MSTPSDEIATTYFQLVDSFDLLKAAWENRITNPEGLRRAQDEHNALGTRLADLMSKRQEAAEGKAT